MSAFSHSTTWTGRTLTVGDLRKLAEATTGMASSDTIWINVEPTYPSPTDPGGQITIRITGSKVPDA